TWNCVRSMALFSCGNTGMSMELPSTMTKGTAANTATCTSRRLSTPHPRRVARFQAGPGLAPGEPWLAPGEPWLAPGGPWLAPGGPWLAPGERWLAPGGPWLARGGPWRVLADPGGPGPSSSHYLA